MVEHNKVIRAKESRIMTAFSFLTIRYRLFPRFSWMIGGHLRARGETVRQLQRDKIARLLELD